MVTVSLDSVIAITIIQLMVKLRWFLMRYPNTIIE